MHINPLPFRHPMKDIDPKEFLRRCPIDLPAAIERYDGKYILILGDRILARDRTVFQPVPNPFNVHDLLFGSDEPSGSIGFINFVPEPNYLKGAFSVYMLGVEGQHQKHGHCETMIDWCEAAAKRLDLPYVVHINTGNETLQKKLGLRGYEWDIGTGLFPMFYKKVGPVHRPKPLIVTDLQSVIRSFF